jgi:hypothetical protein
MGQSSYTTQPNRGYSAANENEGIRESPANKRHASPHPLSVGPLAVLDGVAPEMLHGGLGTAREYRDCDQSYETALRVPLSTGVVWWPGESDILHAAAPPSPPAQSIG